MTDDLQMYTTITVKALGDKELDAMSLIQESLKGLTNKEMTRVLEYTLARYRSDMKNPEESKDER